MRITLCGSARFEGSFHLWNKKLTLAGHTIYGLAVYPSFQEGNKNWYNDQEKEMLDLVHLDKILNSQGIVVIDVDEYYGDSTRREIAWARLHEKRVYWITENSKNIQRRGEHWAGVLLP